MSKFDLIDVDGEIKNETEKAWLFFNGEKEIWLPKSQCYWDPDYKVMRVPEWLCMKEGLI